VQHELVHRGHAPLRGRGAIARSRGGPRRDPHPDEPERERHDDRRGRAHGEPVPSDPLPHPVPRGAPERRDGPSLQEVLEVAAEGLRGRVARRGVRAQRLRDDRLEVRRDGIAPHEPLQDEPKLVDVGRRRHRFAADLLRRRVRGRERPDALPPPLRLLVDEPRDPEVEELHLPVRRHEDVPRLDVAVDDEPPVGELDRAADLAEQLEAPRERGPGLLAVRVERQPVHVLHDEVRLARRGDAPVVHPRDPRVLQAREDAALAEDRLAVGPGGEVAVEDLDRDALLELAVVPLAQEHATHPAAPQLSHDQERPDPIDVPPGPVGLPRRLLGIDVEEHGHPQEVAGGGIRPQEPRDGRPQLEVLRAQRPRLRGAQRLGQVHHRIQDRLDPRPQPCEGQTHRARSRRLISRRNRAAGVTLSSSREGAPWPSASRA